MRGNNFKEKKVVPWIFMHFRIRSHLNQLDPLTPQDVYVHTVFGAPISTYIRVQKSIEKFLDMKCQFSGGGRVATLTSFSIFNSYDMKSLRFKLGYDILAGFKMARL